MFKDGVDQGYKDNQDWWSNPQDPDRYRYANLAEDYPFEYFPLADPGNAINFAITVISYYKKLTGRRLESIVEFGSGGGWYLKEFKERGLNVMGYEGTLAGIQHAQHIGIDKSEIDLRDFRLPMARRFRMADLAICTEVGEHCEPPFAGTLVHNLVNHSSLVWWSSEPPNTNRPHLHHCNEQPLEYWISLFNFFGFGCHHLPEHVHADTQERGQCIFFNRKTYNL